MENCVRIGVVGAGVFGNYHANKCAENEKIIFTGVYDIDKSRAQDTALKHNVKAFDNYADMLPCVDAVIIACAARDHGLMAIQALKSGRHCLIEKPIAATLEDAQAILELSEDKGLIVQVGHQERLVVQAIGLTNIPETPMAIKAVRMGPYSARGTDVSVSLDLMSHDLDLILWLMEDFPKKVTGVTELIHSKTPDVTRARLGFGSAYAELIASRVADGFTRTMNIEYPSGTVHIDFNAKTLEHTMPFDVNIDFTADPKASDSLGAATESFVESILNGTPPIIPARDGYDALRLALMIDAAGEIAAKHA